VSAATVAGEAQALRRLTGIPIVIDMLHAGTVVDMLEGIKSAQSTLSYQSNSQAYPA
jgi:hypothetical protein